MNEEIITGKFFTAIIDVIGFKRKLKEGGSGPGEFISLISSLVNSTDRMQSNKNINFYFTNDNVILWGEQLMPLLWQILKIQDLFVMPETVADFSKKIKNSDKEKLKNYAPLLSRGLIDYGDIHLGICNSTTNYFMSDSFILFHELEKNTIKYPRMVFNTKNIKLHSFLENEHINDFIAVDDIDGLTILKPFSRLKHRNKYVEKTEYGKKKYSSEILPKYQKGIEALIDNEQKKSDLPVCYKWHYLSTKLDDINLK